MAKWNDGQQPKLMGMDFGPEPLASGSGGGSCFVGVVLNRPLDSIFTYRVPDGLRSQIQLGQRVRVPLGKSNVPTLAYCVEITDSTPLDPKRLKTLLEIVDEVPLIDSVILDLTRWMSRYYLCSWGQALDAAVPAGVKKQAGTRLRNMLTITELGKRQRESAIAPKLPQKQADVLRVLGDSKVPLGLADVCRLASCGPNAVTAVKKLGFISTIQQRVANTTEPIGPSDGYNPELRPVLTEDQARTLKQMEHSLVQGDFKVFLLHGVTGSGKTEVYLTAIEKVIEQGREAIVLVPEISLTPQTIRRFRRRFPRVAVLHSHLSDVERHRHWQSIAAGEIQVVVGARSAIFAPTRNLGLIIIDEEHESTFKQETTPRYHARDIAVKRAQLHKVPVILGSATPALETWRNADQHRYVKLTLATRVESRPMPDVTLIDMRYEKPEPGRPPGGLSLPLREAMQRALNDNGQIILLLNRRGFHTYIFCHKCGFVLKCQSCDVALTHHKKRNKVICHACDSEREPPPVCPDCKDVRLIYGGIGTERLEREVKADFGDRVIRRMDSDTMRSHGSHEQALAAFKSGQIDILLGTQMIAKGLDFPNVTLVGVVNADTSLHMPDFRSRERTFQLIAQVAGRTGRGDRVGRVYVQTFCPEDMSIVCAAQHDYLSFVAQEIPKRQEHGYPPFGRLVRIVARGPDEGAVQTFIQNFALSLKAMAGPEVNMLGPAPAPVMKIRDLFRYHLMLRAPMPKPLQDLLHTALPVLNVPHPIEIAVDIDPINML